MPSERMLPVRQVAAMLGVSTATVHKLCAEGRFPHVRVANAIRFRPGEVEGISPNVAD